MRTASDPGSAVPAYTVRRSKRARRARITVTPNGETVVVLPQRAPAALAPQLVAHHADWVNRHVAKIRERSALLAARPPLGAGRWLTIDGLPHLVVVEAGTDDRPARGRVEHRPPAGPAGSTGPTAPAEPTEPVGPHLLLVMLGSDGHSAAQLLEAWLRREARRVLSARVAALSAPLAVSARGLSIRDQRSRWGSASRNGRLSLNWRLVLAPPWILDYVVVHELAHLRVPGHSAAFWAVVRRHAPEADAARRWLREHGPELLAALD